MYVVVSLSHRTCPYTYCAPILIPPPVLLRRWKDGPFPGALARKVEVFPRDAPPVFERETLTARVVIVFQVAPEHDDPPGVERERLLGTGCAHFCHGDRTGTVMNQH